MIFSYLKSTLRALSRRKAYAIINILGLAIGICACILIGTYVYHESTYDTFHRDHEQIYRVLQRSKDFGTPLSGGPMGPTLVKDIPGILNSVSMHFSPCLFANEQLPTPIRFQESDGAAFVGPSFFEVFSYPLLEGDPQSALAAPFQIVLTPASAKKYFGTEPALGKVLRLDNRFDLQVTGIMDSPPSNSHLQFEFLVSYETLYTVYGQEQFDSWWWPSFDVYVKVLPGTDIAHLNETALPEFARRYREEDIAKKWIPYLQPISEVHTLGVLGDDGVQAFLYIFGVIALFVLLIACVNFTNLATVWASRRSREVGIRKVAGAIKGQLITQYLTEAFVITLFAIVLGTGLAEFLLPAFNSLSGVEVHMPWEKGGFWLALVVLTFFTSLLAGSYPAFILSDFQPVKVLKTHLKNAGKGGGLRRALVVFQFVITIVLLICTAVIYSQYEFLRKQSTGYDTDRIIAIRMREARIRSGYEAFKESLYSLPDVKSVSAASWIPGMGQYISFPAEIRRSEEEKDNFQPGILYVDDNFLETMGIGIESGRNFQADFRTDREEAFLVNAATLEDLELDSVLNFPARIFYGEFGKTIYEKKGRVIGVVKDFQLVDARSAVRPTVITLDENNSRITACIVRIGEGDLRFTLNRFEETWKKHFPQNPFEIIFPDAQLEAAYKQEIRLSRILGIFAGLSIFIACLGLLGLAAFTAQQRTKELGIRKVLGAGVG
ncbi:MAG: ABC transporter permease, partial [Bacteroidota bacterium]